MDPSIFYLYVSYQNETYRVDKMSLSLSAPNARITKINPNTFESVNPIEVVHVQLRDVTVIST